MEFRGKNHREYREREKSSFELLSVVMERHDIEARLLTVEGAHYTASHGLESVIVRSTPMQRQLTDKYYRFLYDSVLAARNPTRPLLPERTATVLPVFLGWERQTVESTDMTTLKDVQVFRMVFADAGAPIELPFDVDAPVELAFNLDKREFLLTIQQQYLENAGVYLTYIWQTTTKRTLSVVFHLKKEDGIVTMKEAFSILDERTLSTKIQYAMSESRWTQDHSEFPDYHGLNIERDALYWKTARDMHSLQDRRLLWMNARCTVSFPDMGIVDVFAGNDDDHTIDLYISEPRALFVVRPHDELSYVDPSHIPVETRYNQKYKHHILALHPASMQNQRYAIVLDRGVDWSITLRFHVEVQVIDDDDVQYTKIKRIDLLYENLEVEVLKRDALISQSATSSSGSSSNSIVDIVLDQDILQSIFDAQQLFSTLDDDEDVYSISDISSEIGARLQKKRYHYPSAHYISNQTLNLSTPPSTMVSGLTVHVDHRSIKFSSDHLALSSMTFKRRHRYLLRIEYTVKSKRHNFHANLRLRRHKQHEREEEERYHLRHDDFEFIFLFKQGVLHACHVHQI